ncbi:hypothetical protein V5O48_007189, partial [Marasmius crinis-equi]
MAPVAVEDKVAPTAVDKLKDELNVFNPFYSPSIGDDGDASYEFAEFKPFFPDVKWAPLEEQQVTDRGLSADPQKKNLLSAASK